ncbi:hypothetical protein TNCV_2397401 [Trichonephila clavipes]|uniref:Uncharacterized protein n=1 Tax=Trichonephila clavipes TaxID=2585209 RepID=A0A8X6T4L8_TRICX|nr:hypothetical protein TNCV_2397401 [Trichonephila clavipes]
MSREVCQPKNAWKLAKHEFFLKDDIVSMKTDGARVTKKVGKLIGANQQLCYAHGIQLGVIDVLYQKIRNRRIQILWIQKIRIPTSKRYGSQMAMVRSSWSALISYRFETGSQKTLRVERFMMHGNALSPPIGMVWKFQKGDANSGVILVI